MLKIFKDVAKILKAAAKFIIAFFVMTIVCTIAWDALINGKLYNCTEAIGFDYLHPGDWVHNWDDHKIETVAHVFPDGDMNHPDTIEQGWTITRLWYLWYTFFTTSVVISAVLAFIPWVPRRFNWHS